MNKQKLLPLFISAVIVILFATILYTATASYGFVYDDYYTVITNNDIKDLSSAGLKTIFSGVEYTNYHPLRNIAYGLIYQINNLDSSAFHITNIIFNALNCLLLFILCYVLLTHSFSPINEKHKGLSINIIASLFAAIIYAVHPLHIEATAWVSGFKELLSAFFCLLSLVFFMHLRTGGRDKTPTWSFHLLLLFYIAATLTRPVTVFLPVIMIFFDILNPGAAQRTSFGQRFTEYLFLLSVMAITIILNYTLAIKHQLAPESLSAISLSNFSTSSKSFLFYISKLVAPLHQNVIYNNSVISQYNSFIAFFVLFVFISACVLTVRKAPSISAGLIFFAVSISPSLNIIPVHIAPSEMLTYLPSAGLCIAMAGIIRWISSKSSLLKSLSFLACVIIIVLFTSITTKRIPAWTDNLSLWKNVLTTSPDSPIALCGYADALADINDYENAAIYYKKAIQSNSHYSKSFIGLTKMNLKDNNLQNAYIFVKEGYKHNIYDIEIQYYYGVVLYNIGEFISAAKILVYIEHAHPNFMETRQYLKTTLKVAKNNMKKEDFIKFVENLKLPESFEY